MSAAQPDGGDEERSPTVPAWVRPFTVTSSDGTAIFGQVDYPNRPNGVVVVMVAGTGMFDRDMRFGRSGTDRDLVFKDLAARLVARGTATVRYDRRGLSRGEDGNTVRDQGLAAQSTIESQRDDLRAVYAWTRSPEGLGLNCVVIFAHSEGMAHVGRLVELGDPAPSLLVGMGALMESPASVIQWQVSERDVTSLRRMDVDHDGTVTTREVEDNWQSTPSSFADTITPLLPSDGVWDEADLARVHDVQFAFYRRIEADALSHEDAEPYPNATSPMATYAWWKSWFTDRTPVAERLSAWDTPVSLHYGSFDSQTDASRQQEAAHAAFGPRFSIVIHPGTGHTLGSHATYGPMDEGIANTLANEMSTSPKCRNQS